MRRTAVLAAIVTLLTAAAGQPVRAQTTGGIQLSSARQRAAALEQELVGGPFNSVCSASQPAGSNVTANCDSLVLPHNETAIVVDPNDPAHLLGGSNNTQILNNRGHSAMGYYVSFDGGTTWTNGQVPTGAFGIASDPTVGIDRLGRAYFGAVAFDLGRGGTALGGAIQVSRSNDGGRTFEKPVEVERSTSDGIQEDKEYLTVDNNPGSAFLNSVYITWTRFHFDAADNYLESPIFFSASRDGGNTWSPPREISGTNAALCTFSGTPLPFDGRCKEDQFSTPVVAADGTIFVSFENEQAINDGQFRNQYLVVKSADGGATWSRPVRASDLIHDGANDYPINVVGRQTLSNSQFRVNSAGSLAVSSFTGELAVVWSDNRNGTATNTNTDVFVVRSSDGGNSWSRPAAVTTRAGDQFYPWAAYAPDGTLEVSFFDRSYDPGNSQYGITLARLATGQPAQLQQLDTGLSDPNHARWFASATGGKTTFLGDYNGLAIGGNGVAHAMWTDMRRVVTVKEVSGHTEDVFTAAA